MLKNCTVFFFFFMYVRSTLYSTFFSAVVHSDPNTFEGILLNNTNFDLNRLTYRKYGLFFLRGFHIWKHEIKRQLKNKSWKSSRTFCLFFFRNIFLPFMRRVFYFFLRQRDKFLTLLNTTGCTSRRKSAGGWGGHARSQHTIVEDTRGKGGGGRVCDDGSFEVA